MLMNKMKMAHAQPVQKATCPTAPGATERRRVTEGTTATLLTHMVGVQALRTRSLPLFSDSNSSTLGAGTGFLHRSSGI